MKFRDIWHSITILFSKEVLSIDEDKVPRAYGKVAHFMKLIRITVDTFISNRMGFQCVAMSYFVTLALVPFCAFIFAVTGGMGLEHQLYGLLYGMIPYPDIVNAIVVRGDNIINAAKSGGVGIISALTFLWAILWMMFQVERVFNNVWGIHKIPRNIFKRFGFYLLVFILSPFIMLMFGMGIAYYLNITKLIGLDLSNTKALPEILGWIGFWILSSLIISVMYKFIPATKVKYKYAFKSAIVASLIFSGFQQIYLETQVFVGRLNAVYGVLAAIPLFLIWLNFSWQIIIYGAELTYSYHIVDRNGSFQKWESDE